MIFFSLNNGIYLFEQKNDKDKTNRHTAHINAFMWEV